MKTILFIALVLFGFSAQSQTLQPELFDLLNLEKKGLEEVKKFHEEGKDGEAAKALLNYYQTRTDVKHPDVNLNRVKISKEHQKWADDGLKHIFFVHTGYQPSYFYGDDIDWEYWPVQDNELRWQLHRHKWWSPMGKAYRVSGDEKYAEAWVDQYLDWIKKNPLLNLTRQERKNMTEEQAAVLANNRFAWRPLEVSNRVQDQTNQFIYFLSSEHFTPEFLSEFLVNYYKHANHILNNYSKQGNHLLFEAQRMIYAGAFFPEFKDAEKWRKSGIEILNNEIKEQVFADGFQYELDPRYHLASINIFYKAIQIADVNGFKDEFPASYLETVEKMITAVINYSFPNYENPCFSDSKLITKSEMVKNYKSWAKVFPNNKQIEYFATEGKSGELPSYRSNKFGDSGFYIFRNGWKEDASVMVIKAGPPSFWHNQPDNGTFELYIKGRNFFPDAGSYVYSGDAEVQKERDWFRQTHVHNTLALDNENLETTDTDCLLWDIDNAKLQKLVIENPSYENLNHRRAIFFVDESFFVIVDEAYGTATGNVSVNYQLSEGDVNVNSQENEVSTLYKDNNNIVVKGFRPEGVNLVEKEGWVSYDYRQKNERPAFAFTDDKDGDVPFRFITVIYPNSNTAPKISAKFSSKKMEDNSVGVNLKVGKKKYKLQANW